MEVYVAIFDELVPAVSVWSAVTLIYMLDLSTTFDSSLFEVQTYQCWAVVLSTAADITYIIIYIILLYYFLDITSKQSLNARFHYCLNAYFISLQPTQC